MYLFVWCVEAYLSILSRLSLFQPFIVVIYGSKHNHSCQISFMLLIYLFIYLFIWSIEADLVIFIDCLSLIYLIVWYIEAVLLILTDCINILYLSMWFIEANPVILQRFPPCYAFVYLFFYAFIHSYDLGMRPPGGNAYKLLILRALKISTLYKICIFQCMVRYFVWEFQRYPLKVHTKYLTHTLKDIHFIHRWQFKIF